MWHRRYIYLSNSWKAFLTILIFNTCDPLYISYFLLAEPIDSGRAT